MLRIKPNPYGNVHQSNPICIHLQLVFIAEPVESVFQSQELVVVYVDKLPKQNLGLGHIGLSALLVSDVPGLDGARLINRDEQGSALERRDGDHLRLVPL